MDTELINAARAAIEAGQVTQDGKPLVSAIEAILGRDVTADERDAAYTAILAEGAVSNPSMNGIRLIKGLEHEGAAEPVEADQAAGQADPETKAVTRLVYTGPNTSVNGVPVLRHTVFVGGLPAYMAGFENKCKILGGK